MKALFKFIKIVVITLVVLLTIAVSALAIYEDEVVDQIVTELNKKLTTEVKVGKIDLTLFTDFPNVAIDFTQPYVKDGIEGSLDTLLYAERMWVSFDIVQIVQGKVKLKEFSIENGQVNIKIDKDGQNNFSIFKKDSTSEGGKINLGLEQISLSNVRVQYIDQRIGNNHLVEVQNVDAAMSYEENELAVGLSGKMFVDHIGLHGNEYLRQKDIALSTKLGYHLTDKAFKLDEAKIRVAESEFEAHGWYTTAETDSLDISFSATKSDLSTILSLLPNQLQGLISQYESTGRVIFEGQIAGKLSPKEFPNLKVKFGFDDASLLHPSSGKRITSLNVNGEYGNGGSRDPSKSYLVGKDIKASVNGDEFTGEFEYRNFTDPYLNVTAQGGVRVQSVMEIIPVPKVYNAKGDFEMDVHFEGKLSDLTDINAAEKINTSGRIALVGLNFNYGTNKLPYKNFNGTFHFDKHNLAISEFKGQVGKSDFTLDGQFKNFLSYLLLDNQKVAIKAIFKSKYLDMDELLSQEELDSDEESSTAYKFSVSPNLAYELDLDVDQIKFRELRGDNIGRNFKGNMQLVDQMISYHNVSIETAGGSAIVKGNIDARSEDSIAVNTIGEIKDIDVSRLFSIMENFDQDFLTNKNLNGRLSADFNNQMLFDNKLVLDLKSLKSNLQTNIVKGQLNDFQHMIELGEFLEENKLGRYLKDADLSRINFSELNNTIRIENRTVHVPSMTIKSDRASDISIRGTHSFDQDIDYYISFPLINYKRQERDEERGIYKDPSQKDFHLYLRIVGTTDEFEVIYDKKKTFNSLKEKMKDTVVEALKADDEETIYTGIDTTETVEMFDFGDF